MSRLHGLGSGMKVALVNSHDRTGGAARTAHRLLDGLRRIGVDAHMLVRVKQRDDWAPNAARWVGTDICPGLDVDIVADAHSMSEVFGRNAFDAVVSCSVFEHLKFPWVAAVEIAKVLRPGGIVFVQTHQTFPLHAYAHDYWRFSRESLAAIFGEWAGMEVLSTDYEFSCRIISDREFTEIGESCLNVRVVARNPWGKDIHV